MANELTTAITVIKEQVDDGKPVESLAPEILDLAHASIVKDAYDDPTYDMEKALDVLYVWDRLEAAHGSAVSGDTAAVMSHLNTVLDRLTTS